MSVYKTTEYPISRLGTPPPIPAKTLLLVHQIPELGEQQLREFLDRTVRDGHDIRHLYQVMIDAIRSNKVYLVKELLRCEMPISSIYVREAVKGKAKDILTVFFDNGWDINTPMSGMSPLFLHPNTRCDIDITPLSHAVRFADLPTIDLLLRRGGDVRIGQLMHNAIYRESDTLKVVEILIDRGASLNSLMYQDHQYSWNMFPFMRETPLHTAVALRRHDVIRYLIHKGANLKIENCRGQTVMQSADEDTKRVIMQEIQESSTLHASL
ncbi:hypothetical protein N7489_006135 [Penicillium chrysogenum]|uniref:uncharacterized protein n=1 Tax=Penicillium chrysogenum TaxID=5076 RepID=UPI0024DF2A30|nr:uncharacterized protein N7489_006135 [Penicillium chrysogenum]KAJ5236044.1 hypothetical protein N7489_006135 [Penicillium chrysogenum]